MAVFTVVNCSLAGSNFYLDSTLVVIHLFVGRSLLPVGHQDVRNRACLWIRVVTWTTVFHVPAHTVFHL